jgi:hypothetical protein
MAGGRARLRWNLVFNGRTKRPEVPHRVAAVSVLLLAVPGLALLLPPLPAACLLAATLGPLVAAM